MCRMALSSDSRFRVHHALRIKGFAKVDHISPLAGLPDQEVSTHLEAMQAEGATQFREARGLWQLTPAGRDAHPALLEADAGREGFRDGLAKHYPTFIELNEEFKALCGDWQLRDGAPNDHADAKYDKAVVARLSKLDGHAQKVTVGFGNVAERFAAYAPRLSTCRSALEGGQQNMFTGVMCGSYHDVWMELHEDLILTQNIDRAAEGSF
jgi:hypothetical protein